LAACGVVYGVAALFLGFVFLKKAWQLKQNPFDRDIARSLFKYSILYMMLLCTAMVIDSLPMTSRLLATIASLFSCS
jgi:protoheme IX farnesyltransferase